MIYVVELHTTGPNIFKSAGNFLTYDTPDPTLIGQRIFWTADEARAAHIQGSSIFGDFGPAGYMAFKAFETFLRGDGVIPPLPAKKHTKWRKPRPTSSSR